MSVLLGNGAGSFAPLTNYGVGANPRSLICADFNNDGKADLAIANNSGNNISILLGSGTGTFSTAVDYAAGSSPVSITSSDFNNDGKIDIAVANNGGNNVSILLGSGTGTFSPAVNYAAGSSPASITSSDFNNDGKIDIAVANNGGNNVSILLGSGLGTFAVAVDYSVGANPYSLINNDFNSDGKTDLAIANAIGNNVSVLLGDGLGAFAPMTNYGVGLSPRSIISADFNSDGKTDIATATYNINSTSVLLNTSVITGSALNFDGVNDRVSINNSITNSFTLETYIKTSSPSATGSNAWQGSGIMDADVPGVANDFILSILNNRVAFWDGSSSVNVVSTSTVTDGTWKHVALTRAAGGQIKLYINGVLESTGTAGGASLNANPLIYFGNNFNAGTFTNISMDETRIWNRVLCQAEIQNNMNGELPPGQYGLLSYYNYNQGFAQDPNPSITSLTDLSGNANNGTLSNFALTGTTSNWVSPGAVTTGSNASLYASTSISISGANSICSGSSTTFTASGAVSSYTWNTGSTTSTISVTPTVTTTYSVVGTNSVGCISNVATKTLTVNALPTASITGVAVICSGQSTTLTATGGTSYAWSTGATTPTINVSVGGSYTSTITNVEGCSTATVRTVVVNPLPTPAISGLNTICVGQTTTLTASGGGSYLWSTGATTSTIAVSPTVTTLYTATVTSALGCTATASRNIMVNNLPTPNITGTSTICEGQSTTLTASGGTSYIWSTGAITAAINVSPSVDAAYTATVTNASGCSATAVRNVTVNALPTASITGTAEICNLQSTVLTATGGSSYVWSTGATTSTISVNPSTNTAYTSTVTSAAGCTATAVRNLTVNALPVITTQPASVAVCGNASGTFTVIASNASIYSWEFSGNNVTFSPTTGMFGETGYTTSVLTIPNLQSLNWNGYYIRSVVTSSNGCNVVSSSGLITVNVFPTITVNSGSICAGQSFTITPNGADTYTISGGNSIVSPTVDATYNVIGTSTEGCVSSNTAVSSITVNPLPTITVNSGSICVGQSFTLTPSGADTYTISSGNSIVSPTADATYNVIGTDLNGCVSTAAVASVTVNALPVITVNSGSICAGQSFTLTPSGADTYTISGGNSIVSPTANATYSISGTDLNGCVSNLDAVASVTVNSLPTVSAGTNNTLLCVGETATLTASGASTYTWSTSQTSAIITVSPSMQTTYTVNGTDANGCENSTSITQNVNACTGINEVSYSANELLVYPNPSNGEFNVSVSSATKITIIDVMGKVVYAEQLESGLHSVNLNQFANGIYLLKAESNGNAKTIRLIKE